MVRFFVVKAAKTYIFDPNVRTCRYRLNSGEFAATDDGTSTAIGYFATNSMPKGYVESSNLTSGGGFGAENSYNGAEPGAVPNAEVIIPGHEPIPDDVFE